MKPFPNCPVCDSEFYDINHNTAWWQQLCKARCDADFSQFFPSSFQDEHLSYASFYTKDFHLYLYFEHYYNEKQRNLMYLYNRIFPRGESVQNVQIIAKIPEIDFKNLDKLNNKLKIWNMFK